MAGVRGLEYLASACSSLPGPQDGFLLNPGPPGRPGARALAAQRSNRETEQRGAPTAGSQDAGRLARALGSGSTPAAENRLRPPAGVRLGLSGCHGDESLFTSRLPAPPGKEAETVVAWRSQDSKV